MKCVIVIIAILMVGCSRPEVANSAASIWEAADAIEKGASPTHCVRIIKSQAAAIIIASGSTYKPAGVK